MVASLQTLRCAPTFATRRRLERLSFGDRLGRIAAEMGQPFMPWQQFVADVGCELLPSGLPAYREIVVTVPRQSGKTSLFFAWLVDRSVGWPVEQRSVFTAQTGKDARDKWLDELIPALRRSSLDDQVRRVSLANGNEAIHWHSGSIIRLLSTSQSSGHSKTLDLAVMDEIWADTDDRREQGLRPALITRPDAQLLVCSTAGTVESVVLNRKRQMGRAAVAADAGRGVAYFEWSAPDDWDPDDDESYFSFMPALCPDPPCRCGEVDGWAHTMTLEAIRLERQAMEPMEFQRAYGNRTTASSDAFIPAESWARVVSADVAPVGELRFGFDVDENLSAAAICVSDGRVCEVVDHRPGTGWVIARCNELSEEHGAPIIVDGSGPAAAFAPEIRRVKKRSRVQVMDACAQLFDAIKEQRVSFRAHPSFDRAVAGLGRRQSGDRWIFSRKASSEDITPLMAATLAFSRRPSGAVFF